jgi:hypothetical protein
VPITLARPVYMSDHMPTPYVMSREILRSPYAPCYSPFVTKKEIRDYFAKFGKEGGKARAKNLTPEQRKASARKAAEARWAKQRKAQNG